MVLGRRENVREFHTPLYLCFVDLRKACDSVNCDELWAVLKKRYQAWISVAHRS